MVSGLRVVVIVRVDECAIVFSFEDSVFIGRFDSESEYA